MESKKQREPRKKHPASEELSDSKVDTVAGESAREGQLSESELESAAGGFGTFATTARRVKSSG